MRPMKGLLLLTATCAMTLATTAFAAAPAPASGARQTYLQDREFCNSGRSSQDRQTCLREAGAALQEAPRGNLTEAPDQNRYARCEYHKNLEDRNYCMRRMSGEGTVSGSYEGGGIIRELKVIVPME